MSGPENTGNSQAVLVSKLYRYWYRLFVSVLQGYLLEMALRASTLYSSSSSLFILILRTKSAHLISFLLSWMCSDQIFWFNLAFSGFAKHSAFLCQNIIGGVLLNHLSFRFLLQLVQLWLTWYKLKRKLLTDLVYPSLVSEVSRVYLFLGRSFEARASTSRIQLLFRHFFTVLDDTWLFPCIDRLQVFRKLFS